MEHALAKEAKQKMEKAIEAFQHELVNVRTGRASVGLLDSIEVDVYGSKMKLNQLGTVSAPEARLLTITPWDKTQIRAIEKAILASPLDLNPANDGKLIRIPIPPLTEDRRRDLVKLISKLAEEARVSVRNVRRHYVDETKKEQKDGKIPEDDAHKLTAHIQKITDECIAKIDDILKHKEAEIMEV
ncbi:MAG TPA: ribosome recycling factor [Candidatus Hydrogenedentes bacterium]|nr:ribosome recycling factor [Candidatus Hydrogenedentota bacterium]HOS01851.1 ribosome recycling factor [Candidatus Hydrogenedentota bacterium]